MRTNRLQADADALAIAADERAGLRLAVALQEGNPERLEEDPDLRIERRAARYPGLDPAAHLGADLAPKGQREDAIHRHVPGFQPALIFVRADLQRAIEKVFRKAAARLDRLDDSRPEQLEQARHDDHDRRLHFLDVRRQFLEAFRVIDLGAERDRKHLAARMLIGMARRKKGEEYLLVPAEVARDN